MLTAVIFSRVHDPFKTLLALQGVLGQLTAVFAQRRSAAELDAFIEALPPVLRDQARVSIENVTADLPPRDALLLLRKIVRIVRRIRTSTSAGRR